MYLRVFLLISLFFSFFSSHSQKIFEDYINVSSGNNVDNRDAVIYLPANYAKTKAYPLVIFTHGMGEAGKDAKKLYKQGLPKVLKNGYRPAFDFIMVAVQRNSFSVSPEWLPGILKDCQKRWNIDDDRIYLTGISAGGWAVYGSQLNFSPAFAKKFAAIVINSGVTHNTNKKNFDWWKQTKTPLWAIVGGADKGYVGKNAYMVNEINKRVPKLAALTIRPGVGHGGWSDVYNGKVKLNGKNMWEWLYQFKRSTNESNNNNGNGGTDDDDEDDDGVIVPPSSEPPAAKPKYVKVNIYKGYNAYNSTAWNNWNVGSRDSTNIEAGRFKYTDGKPSTIRATLSNTLRVVDNLADYGSGMAPAEVLRYTSYSSKARTLTIKGLSSTKQYNITLYGSRRRRPGNTTLYSIDGKSKTVITNNNLTEKATFTNLKPDGRGRIVVKIENLNTYNYLNGFIISEKIATSGN